MINIDSSLEAAVLLLGVGALLGGVGAALAGLSRLMAAADKENKR